MGTEKIVFGIVGSGWRAECFLKVAKELPDMFQVCGLVTRSEEKNRYITSKWDLPVYTTVEALLGEHSPSFILMAVSKQSAAGVILNLTSTGIPVLAETPPARSVDELIDLHKRINKQAKIQVAEQYHLQPTHAARLSVVQSSLIGSPSYAQVSISQGYHSVSLLRKYLGIAYENALIKAHEFSTPSIEGPSRKGYPTHEQLVQNKHTIAILDFDGKVGCHNFENNQHRSWIRSQGVTVRGSHGEIKDSQVRYLKDFLTPIEFELKRQTAGEYENLEGFHLKGIIGNDKWLYRNPFIPARMSDEEIALGTTLVKMDSYVKTGSSFYSLEEASQDQYLSLMIDEALANNCSVRTETQIWAK